MNSRSNFKKILSSFLVMSVVCGGDFVCNDIDAMSKDAVENIKKIGKVVGIPLATFLVGGTVGVGTFKISDNISKKKDKTKREYKNEGVCTENVNERELVDFGTQAEARTIEFQEIKSRVDELCNLKEIYKRFCTDPSNSNYFNMQETINECKRTLANTIGSAHSDNGDNDSAYWNDFELAYNACVNIEGFAQRTINCLQVIQNCRTSIEGMLPPSNAITKKGFIGVLDSLKNSLDGANYLSLLTTVMKLESDDKVMFADSSNKNMTNTVVSFISRALGGNRSLATEVTFAKPENIAEKIFDDNYESRLIYGKMSNAKRKFIIGAIRYKYDQITKSVPTNGVQ